VAGQTRSFARWRLVARWSRNPNGSTLQRHFCGCIFSAAGGNFPMPRSTIH
jgi:hypothetical protein